MRCRAPRSAAGSTCPTNSSARNCLKRRNAHYPQSELLSFLGIFRLGVARMACSMPLGFSRFLDAVAAVWPPAKRLESGVTFPASERIPSAHTEDQFQDVAPHRSPHQQASANRTRQHLVTRSLVQHVTSGSATLRHCTLPLNAADEPAAPESGFPASTWTRLPTRTSMIRTARLH